MTRATAQRGAGVVIALILIIAAALSGLLINASFNEKEIRQQRQQQDKNALQNARLSLITYQLLRADNLFKIGVQNKNINPRLLMLPCPDNWGGDNNLDGVQDATCGARGGNVVNDILQSGSRFGRLPWRKSKAAGNIANNNKINDGLGGDFRDSSGNRLWYAVSRHFAPKTKNQRTPLNLHRLSTLEDEWLAVVNEDGGIVDSRVAAVILSPGIINKEHLSEKFLLNNELQQRPNPRDYFEELNGEKNYDSDGVFVRAESTEKFNDKLTYIAERDLLSEKFVRPYSQIIGIGETQNQPRPGSRLSELKTEVKNFYDYFGFYPTPAKNKDDSVNTPNRHCAAFHLDNTEPGIVQNVTLIAADDYPNGANANFIAAHNLTVVLTSIVRIVDNDIPNFISIPAITIARHSRVKINNITASVFAGQLLTNAVTIIIPRKTPILPDTPNHLLHGWFPEHNKPPKIANNRDGNDFTVQSDTVAGFLAPTILTNAIQTVTLSAADKLIIPKGETIQFRSTINISLSNLNLSNLNPISGTVIFADGRITTIINAKPTPASFEKRRFVILLTVDAVRNNQTITAPAVLYPWRKKTTASALVITRDNLHPYPPCFDSRNIADSLRVFIEDQPLHYAVAKNCHYGGGCENGGITVTVAKNARVALPAAHLINHDFAVTIQFQTVVVNNGILQNSVFFNSKTPLPLIKDDVLLGKFYFAEPTKFTVGQTLTIPKNSIFAAADSQTSPTVTLQKVQALLIYSPAPLRRVQCTIGTSQNTFNQQHPGGDLTNLCMWLDDDENADGDNVYILPAAKPPRRKSPQTNDFFILFGGALTY